MTHALRPFVIDDKTLRDVSAIVNRACFVEAAPHLREACILVRSTVMREKFRRAVIREQIRAV
jgi:hypothetical protein